MNSLLHFLTYNLAASILAGLLLVAVILFIARILGIRDARTRNNLFGLALLKSTLVLAGIGTILPLPAGLWGSIREQAVPPELIVPILVVWSGLLVLGHELVKRRAFGEAGEGAADPAALDRVNASVNRVLDEFKRHDTGSEGVWACCIRPRPVPAPRAIVTEGRASPAVVCDDTPPTLFMPAALVSMLDDDELDAIVAHELGHVLVNAEQGGCTARWARFVRLTSPASLMLSRLLDREEELACDEVAARVTGRPEAVASALLKTYRFRGETAGLLPSTASHLLPYRPLLQQRIRRLAQPDPLPESPSRLRIAVVWAVTGFLLFSF